MTVINDDFGSQTKPHTIFSTVSWKINPLILLLSFCMLSTGACGFVVEMILATTTTYILGNSIEQYAIVIALMLAAMGVSGWMQRFIPGKYLFEQFIGIEVLMAVLGGFAPIALYGAYGVITDHFNLTLYSLVFTIGALIGFEIPLVMRIVETHKVALKDNLALINGVEYIGAFVGAVLWVVVLLRYFPLTESSFIVAGINFSVAVMTMAYVYKGALFTNAKLALGVIVLTAMVLTYGYTSNRDWSVNLEQRLYDDRIIFSTTTRYQHLVVTEDSTTGNTKLFINGNVQFGTSDEDIYHDQLVHPVMALVPDHKNVLILGGGDGIALREILKYEDVKNVHLVDLDPDMIRLARDNEVLRSINHGSFDDARVFAHGSNAVQGEGSRPVFQETGMYDQRGLAVTEKVANVEIITVDADRFVSDISGMYNVIIIDLPDPSSVELTKLYSRSFYAKLRKKLAKNGMLVVQSTSPMHAKEAFLTIGRTLNAAGFQTTPYHDNIPSYGGSWGWHLAWKSNMPSEALRERIDDISEFQVETEYLTPDVFRGSLAFGKGWLDTDFNTVNTVMHPVLLDHYLRFSWLTE